MMSSDDYSMAEVVPLSSPQDENSASFDLIVLHCAIQVQRVNKFA